MLRLKVYCITSSLEAEIRFDNVLGSQTAVYNEAHPNIGVWNQEHWHSVVQIWVWDQESRILTGLYGP